MALNIVTDFGADPTGTTDSTVAIQNALDSGPGKLIAPPGNYLVSDSLEMKTSCQSLYAEAKGSAVFISSAAGPTIIFSGNPAYAEISNLMVTRATAATAGQNAIDTTGSSLLNFARFDNLIINNHWNAFNLGYGAYSSIDKCYIQQNYSDGISMQALPGDGAFGWNIHNTLSELNDGYAMAIRGAITGTGQCGLGEWINFSSFANKLGGIAVLGTSHTSFPGIRMLGGFLGEDGGTELWIDAYSGFSHLIANVYTELAGTRICGRNQATAATNTGYGVYISSNNSETNLIGAIARGHSLSGMFLTGAKMTLNACEGSYNGAANVTGNKNGIYLAGGRAIITGGNYIGNDYGLNIINDNHIITNNNLYPNQTAPYYSAVPFVKTKFDNNLIS